MNNFERFLRNILGLPEDISGEISYAKRIVVWAMGLGVPLTIAVSLLFAYLGGGWKMANLVVSYVMLIAIFCFATWPRILFGVLGLGIVDPQQIREGSAKWFKRWTDFVLLVMLVVTAFFYFMGTLPISRNLSSIIPALMGAILLLLLSTKVKYAKTLVYIYTVCVMTLSIGGMIAPELFYKSFGFDPVPFLSFSSADHRYARIQGKLHDAKVVETDRCLAEIEAKVDQGIPLSFQEEQFLRQYREKNSLTGKVRKIMYDAGQRNYNPSRPPAEIKWLGFGEWPIKLKAGESMPYRIGIKSPVRLEYNFINIKGRFERHYSGGDVFQNNDDAPCRPDPVFWVRAITDMESVLKINPK